MKELINAIRNSGFTRFGVRHLCEDENYEIGDETRCFYDWDYEYDCSTYETDDPVELNGSCAYELSIDKEYDSDEEIEKMVKTALEESSCYNGDKIVLLGCDVAYYGNDDGEIVMMNAEVIYKF